MLLPHLCTTVLGFALLFGCAVCFFECPFPETVDPYACLVFSGSCIEQGELCQYATSCVEQTSCIQSVVECEQKFYDTYSGPDVCARDVQEEYGKVTSRSYATSAIGVSCYAHMCELFNQSTVCVGEPSPWKKVCQAPVLSPAVLIKLSGVSLFALFVVLC